MNPTAIEIKYTAAAGAKGRTVRQCKTLITDKGVVRVTFERALATSKTLPVREVYEYHVAPEAAIEQVLSAFGWAALHAEDKPAKGEAYWQLTVYQPGKNLRLKGASEPLLFGSRLSDAVLGLVKYKQKPILFGE